MKIKDPLIFCKFYVNDYPSRFSDHSAEEFGVAMRLLCVYISRDGNFPTEEEKLFRACGAITENEKQAVGRVISDVTILAKEILSDGKKLRDKNRKNGKNNKGKSATELENEKDEWDLLNYDQ